MQSLQKIKLPFIHHTVAAVCSGCSWREGEVYNIGTDSERTVLQVAQDIAKRFNMGVDKIVNVKDRAFNDR
eukprot:1161749-Pelagomonas_calceolata.AAC.2